MYSETNQTIEILSIDPIRGPSIGKTIVTVTGNYFNSTDYCAFDFVTQIILQQVQFLSTNIVKCETPDASNLKNTIFEKLDTAVGFSIVKNGKFYFIIYKANNITKHFFIKLENEVSFSNWKFWYYEQSDAISITPTIIHRNVQTKLMIQGIDFINYKPKIKINNLTFAVTQVFVIFCTLSVNFKYRCIYCQNF